MLFFYVETVGDLWIKFTIGVAGYLVIAMCGLFTNFKNIPSKRLGIYFHILLRN